MQMEETSCKYVNCNKKNYVGTIKKNYVLQSLVDKQQFSNSKK